MRRAAAAAVLGVLALLSAPPTASAASGVEREPVGWAATGPGTTGGAGGTTWTVRTRAELKEALAHHGDPTAPKVIRVVGDINGHEAADGSLFGEQDYAPGYDLAKYMSCFGQDGAEWSDARHDDPGLAVAPYGGERFHDTGSWANGRPARLNTVAAGLGLTDDVGWDPADVYDYRPLTSAAAVEHHVLTHAGTGRRYARP
ncbi:hypothetical protein [Streptomyces viridochromogenes]|uniref:hypothetical protein n=1 Tax=Streptomyces viridochromogenes TaxID=1938 RepID=UPI00069DCE76|nr:hypothetical protein [Streptomyces viridochromogenes]KOG19857.1 hypothetical protein ADK36_18495 [Streptomyces viridochromogenes]KOG20583.1 hypothetical protein ADK35_18245 [Streptomyces viridochromogenes]